MKILRVIPYGPWNGSQLGGGVQVGSRFPKDIVSHRISFAQVCAKPLHVLLMICHKCFISQKIYVIKKILGSACLVAWVYTFNWFTHLISATDVKQLEMLETILMQVTSNTRLLGRLLQQSAPTEAPEMMLDETLPLRNFEEAQELDGRLQDDNLQKTIVSFMLWNSVAREAVTTGLARGCNWAGQRGPKKPFGSLKRVIMTIVSKCIFIQHEFWLLKDHYTCKFKCNYAWCKTILIKKEFLL